MENPRPEGENIIKETRNLFRLKNKLNYTAIKDIRNLFKQEKNKAIRIEYLEILRTFLSIKKKKIIINQ